MRARERRLHIIITMISTSKLSGLLLGSLALALSRTCFHLPRSSSITVHRMHYAMVIIITIAFAAMNIPHHSDYRYYAIIISLISLLRRVHLGESEL